MKTKVEYTNDILKLMIQDDGKHAPQIKGAFYQEEGNYYVKTFQGKFPNTQLISDNFNRLVPYLFEAYDWETTLLFLAEFFKRRNILWFLTGSACDAVRGIDIVPHDLDIEIYSKHWSIAGDAVKNYIIEPFIKTEGWVRENFGRIVVNNMLIDMVSDANYDLPRHEYEPYVWKGYTLWLEPFMTRYKTELTRNRKDRIQAFKQFFLQRGIETNEELNQ